DQLVFRVIDDIADLGEFRPGAMEDSSIRYVSYAIDQKTALLHLDEALRELEGGDSLGAEFDLIQLQKSMLQYHEDAVSQRDMAKDHVALAAVMVEHGQLKAADHSV